MSETKTVNTTSGISFIGLLQIVFITLKLCKVIDWSWWWVMAPFELWLIIGFLLVSVVILLAVTVKILDMIQKRVWRKNQNSK